VVFVGWDAVGFAVSGMYVGRRQSCEGTAEEFGDCACPQELDSKPYFAARKESGAL